MDFGNLIIEYANESGGKYKIELIKAGKLLGKGDPFALASYLESMEDSSRDIFFKIIQENKNPMSLMEEQEQRLRGEATTLE